jgi:hypothetical protein
MRDLAPSIVRQRLLIEGIIGIDVVRDSLPSSSKCKGFDAAIAVEATRRFFAMKDVESQPF